MTRDHQLTRRALLAMAAISPLMPGDGQARETALMKIKFAFSDQAFTATLFDNPSAVDFAAMLPLEIEVSDFSTNEKIAYLPRKLVPAARGPFPNPAPGDLCYYIPWGNLALFHGDYVSTGDLIRLGRLDGEIEPLLTRGTYPMRITRIS